MLYGPDALQQAVAKVLLRRKAGKAIATSEAGRLFRIYRYPVELESS